MTSSHLIHYCGILPINMADESVGDMEVMSEHTAVMETEVDQSDAPTPVLGDGGDKKEEKKEKSGEEDSGEGSSSAKNYPDDKEIVLINPTFGDLPTNLSSVKVFSFTSIRFLLLFCDLRLQT